MHVSPPLIMQILTSLLQNLYLPQILCWFPHKDCQFDISHSSSIANGYSPLTPSFVNKILMLQCYHLFFCFLFKFSPSQQLRLCCYYHLFEVILMLLIIVDLVERWWRNVYLVVIVNAFLVMVKKGGVAYFWRSKSLMWMRCHVLWKQ